jgi:hypothetical protein
LNGGFTNQETNPRVTDRQLVRRHMSDVLPLSQILWAIMSWSGRPGPPPPIPPRWKSTALAKDAPVDETAAFTSSGEDGAANSGVQVGRLIFDVVLKVDLKYFDNGHTNWTPSSCSLPFRLCSARRTLIAPGFNRIFRLFYVISNGCRARRYGALRGDVRETVSGGA